MDFTLKEYSYLLETLLSNNFMFTTFSNYLELKNSFHFNNKALILLRHDVDEKPFAAFNVAQIEQSFGIKATYNFKIIEDDKSYQILKKISGMGHEIGYHYDEMYTISKKIKAKKTKEELIDEAYKLFCKNLMQMRKAADIKTICMHGSPYSKFDNKSLWEKYNYTELGIIGEPYINIDWNKFAYFTDTGRRWNGFDYSVRDKVISRYNFNFKTTREIIQNVDKLPNKIMFTIHPQRWTDSPISWIKEYVSQNVKNVVKRILIRRQYIVF